MDLAKFDTKTVADEGVELQLRDPGTGQPIDVFITLHGLDSDVFRDAQLATLRRRRELLEKEKRERTAEEALDDAVTLQVACTKAWRNVELHGAQLECTPANARMLYTRFPWVREQVDSFVLNRANFLPRSVNGSSPSRSTNSN